VVYLPVTFYYHNNNWQVLLEAALSISTMVDLRYFVYGNYIDEPLLMADVAANPDEDYYYVHDHLYSPTALLADDGTAAQPGRMANFTCPCCTF
jgi:hypothetical protein